MSFVEIDRAFISFARKYRTLISTVALSIVYTWFGALKMLGFSPATPLVLALLHRTMPWWEEGSFMVAFGAFEVLIGVLFLFPKAVRVTIFLMLVHMVIVCLPLILLSGMIFTAPFVPTLEGQYIIKNIVLVALALTIVAGTEPMKR